MVKRVLKQQQPLCATLLELKKGDMMPSDSELLGMESYVEMMKPLVEMTEAMESEKWITISTLQHLLHQLLINYLVDSTADNTIKKCMKKAMLSDLKGRYTGDLLQLLTKATYLDPRLKSLSYLNSIVKEEMLEELEAEAVSLALSLDHWSEDELAPKRAGGEHVPLRLIGEVIDTTDEDQETIVVPQKIQTELLHYRAEALTHENPLKWWKANSHKYPVLSVLSKKYLAIPATSVPSERVFSAAGNIVSEKRSCLLRELVSRLVFLAKNLQ